MVTLQQLYYFSELAKHGHLTRTAEKLYITQTTLSNTIINLEKQLGVKLFDRVGRTLQLSEVGKQYFQYVNEALISLENAHTMINDFKEGAQLTVSVAMNNSNVWASLIHGFRTQYSSYNIRQFDYDNALFHSKLINQEIDFVIAGSSDVPLSDLKQHVLREETLYLCVSRDHPFADRPSIHLEEAKDESFIMQPQTTGFRTYCDHLFQKADIKCNVAIECDYMLRGKLVEAGFGVAITTQISRSQNLLGANVVYVPLADEFARRPISIIWNPRHYLSRAAKDFRDYVIETVK